MIRSHHKLLEYAIYILHNVYSCDAYLVLDCIRFNGSIGKVGVIYSYIDAFL